MSDVKTGAISMRASLSTKMVVSLIVALLVGLAATTYLISVKSARTTEDLSVQSGKELGAHMAAGVQRDINVALRVTETMRDAFVGLYSKGIRDRETYLALLESAVKANQQYVAVWTAWEPNAFDGKDQDFANADGKATFPDAKAYDATGRFVPYVFAKDGGFDVTPLTDYDKPGAGDYYLLAQKSGKQQIIEPYPYVVGDKTVIMTSLVTPIIIDGKVLGVVGLDLDLAAIQNRLAEIKPYETGAVSLISAQGNWAAYADLKQLMKPIEAQEPDLAKVKDGVTRGQAFDFPDFSDTRKIDLLRVFQPVEVGQTGTPWSVMVDLPEDKILQPSRDLTLYTVVASALLVIALSVIIFVLMRLQVATPLRRLTATVDTLAGGDTAVDVPSTQRRDELGVMARAINIFREKLIEVDELRHQRAEAEKVAALEKKQMMQTLADGFEQSVKSIVDAVSAAANHLQSNAQSMAGVAESSSHQAGAVAAAANEASASVTTVATAAEELSASIAEITRQMTESASSTRQAVSEVGRMGDTIESLNGAADKIGGIVQIINEIASQTNLLALNATIEAARAGDAGKGFAVVASEVKTLATQTARATDEIASQIDSMQSITRDAVSTVGMISTTIDRVNEIASAIAAAVEEQSAATREISNNAQQAASGTNEVNSNINGVSTAVQEAGHASGIVLNAANQLSTDAVKLRHEVDTFIAKIRAG
ncbi:MAG TPA: methyl-accepting chemotaxis protein [Dongiaceae bacterium]|nr:methyl-accepting chemotaxis protein [Dongiaceae bacterium]